MLALMPFIGNKIRSIGPYFKFAIGCIIVATIMNLSPIFANNTVTHTLNILVAVVFFVKYFEGFDEKSIQYILDGMILGSLIQGVFGISGYFGYEMYFNLIKFFLPDGSVISSALSGSSNVVGSLDNPNLLASYLCITIPAFFSRKKILPLIIVPTTALILSNAYMGIFSLVAGALYFINSRYSIISKMKVYILTIFFMLLFPLVNTTMDSGRFYIWKKILSESTIYHWLFGFGPGWFADRKMIIEGNTNIIQEHNAFLTFFNIYGLRGFIVLAPVFYTFMKTKDRNVLLSTTLFIVFCNSYGHFTSHQSTVIIIFIPLLAICLADSEKSLINS